MPSPIIHCWRCGKLRSEAIPGEPCSGEAVIYKGQGHEWARKPKERDWKAYKQQLKERKAKQ